MSKKLLFTLAIILVLVSCKKEDIWYELTPDEMEWICYNGEELVVWEKKDYNLNYLLNGTDTITINASAGTFSEENCYKPGRPSHYDEIWYGGYGDVSFGSDFGLTGNVEISTYKSLSVKIHIPGSSIYFSPQQTIDTALVNGKLYDNVLKYYPLDSESEIVEAFYFRKGSGYIKVVKRDGSFIELIK